MQSEGVVDNFFNFADNFWMYMFIGSFNKIATLW